MSVYELDVDRCRFQIHSVTYNAVRLLTENIQRSQTSYTFIYFFSAIFSPSKERGSPQSRRCLPHFCSRIRLRARDIKEKSIILRHWVHTAVLYTVYSVRLALAVAMSSPRACFMTHREYPHSSSSSNGTEKQEREREAGQQ